MRCNILPAFIPPILAEKQRSGGAGGPREAEGQEERAGIRPLCCQPGTFRAKHAGALAQEFCQRGTMQQTRA